MLTSPNHLLVHNKFGNCFPEDFLYQILQDRGEADQPTDPLAYSLSSLKIRVTFAFFCTPVEDHIHGLNLFKAKSYCVFVYVVGYSPAVTCLHFILESSSY